MTNLSTKIKIILIIDLVIFIFCVFGIFQTFEKAGLEPNAHISFDISDGKVFINSVNNPDLHKILNKGDRLVAINDHPVTVKEDIEFIFDSFQIGQKATISIIRNGLELQKEIILPSYYSIFYLIVQIIVGCVFFLNGVFVIYERPDDRAAWIWHWATICTAVIIMCTWGRFSISPAGSGHLIRNVFSAAYAFVPTLYLHLTFIFPVRKLKGENFLLNPLYTFSLLLAIWMIVTFELAASNFSIDWFHNHLIGFDIVRIYFAGVIFIGMGNLIHSYIKAREESEKRKLRWVLTGLAIGPPAFVILWQIPQLLALDSIIPEEIIVLFMIIVPLSFTISIVKYHIFNIDLIIQRSTVYIIIISIILVLYIGIVAISAFIIGSFTLQTSIIASVITAIIIPFIFEAARLKVQHFIDKKFFRVNYNYRLTQKKLTSELNDCINIESMAKLLVNKLNTLLKPKFIGIFLLNEMSKKLKLLFGVNYESITKDILDILNNIAIANNSNIYAKQNIIEPGIEFENLDNHSDSLNESIVAIPVKIKEHKSIGFLICGEKKSETRYGIEDIDLLTTMCSQMGSAIDRIRLQKELLLQYEETQKLEEINKLKSFFVSSVSHEMQTPLTSIKMFSELLQSKKQIPQQEQKEYLEIIVGETERLSRLIKNVLDFSRIERGVKEYKFGLLFIQDAIDEVLRSMKYQLRQNNFTWEVKLPDTPLKMVADKDAFIEALYNLISNAIKYSGNDKYVSISVHRDKSTIIISVSDKGVGISKSDQKHIFDAFYRSKEENVHSLGGTGLGLTLVQDIMQAHDGQVKIESKIGEGSTFSLIFPERKHE